jgi:hypothetical protein
MNGNEIIIACKRNQLRIIYASASHWQAAGWPSSGAAGYRTKDLGQKLLGQAFVGSVGTGEG